MYIDEKWNRIMPDLTHPREVIKFQDFLISLPINESCKGYRVQQFQVFGEDLNKYKT